MASTTKIKKARKAIKKARAGKARKNRIRIDGSTAPNLPLDKPTANELAMKKASSAAGQ